jgi:hypothetical protein
VGPIAGMDAVEYRKISYPCRESNPGRPAHSTSLFRLRHPGSHILGDVLQKEGVTASSSVRGSVPLPSLAQHSLTSPERSLFLSVARICRPHGQDADARYTNIPTFSKEHSVVGIATGYGLDDRGVGVRVPVGSIISLLQVVQTGFGANPASYPMGTGGLIPRG